METLRVGYIGINFVSSSFSVPSQFLSQFSPSSLPVHSQFMDRTDPDGPGQTQTDPNRPGWTWTDPEGPGQTSYGILKKLQIGSLWASSSYG